MGKQKNNRYHRKINIPGKKIAIALLAAVFLECTLFNFHFYGDLINSYPHVSGTDYQLVYDDEKITRNGDDFIISGTGEYSLEYKKINSEVFNIYVNGIQSNQTPVKVKIGVKDEANTVSYYYGPETQVYSKVKSSQYVNLNTNGKVQDIIVTFIAEKNNCITIHDIGFNSRRTFQFLGGRVLAVWLLGIFIFAFRYRKSAYEILYDSKKKWQKVVIYGVLALQMLFSAWTVNTSYQYGESQLNRLADALLKGQVYLEEQVPESLLQLENPYDVKERSNSLGSDYWKVWDYSYYNGKLYVYFGVLPVLLLYIPAKLLYHTTLNSNQVILMLAFAVIILSKILLDQIIRVWYKKGVPFLPYVLCLIAFINASGIMWSLRRPDFYDIYGPAGLVLTMLGLALWLASIRDDNKIKLLPLTAGSVCMALVAGCRPNWLIYSILAIPVFWEPVFSKLRKPGKKQIVQILGMASPYLLIGIAAMWYNYTRFGSVFEFGSHYQLTVADMRFASHINKLPFGIWWYYLAMPVMNLRFPFFYTPQYVKTYQGQYFIDSTALGTIFMNLILVFLFCLPKMKDWMKQQKKGLYGFCLTGIIAAFVQSCIVILTGGIHQRYVMDFVPIYLIIAIVIIFAVLVKNYNTKTYQILNKILLVCFVCTMVFQAAVSMRGESDQLKNCHPEIYYRIERAVEFWL